MHTLNTIPYSTKEDALKHKVNSVQTNNRYSNFKQTHFTAGDKNQFDNKRIYDPILGIKMIDLRSNSFNDFPIPIDIGWENTATLLKIY